MRRRLRDIYMVKRYSAMTKIKQMYRKIFVEPELTKATSTQTNLYKQIGLKVFVNSVKNRCIDYIVLILNKMLLSLELHILACKFTHPQMV